MRVTFKVLINKELFDNDPSKIILVKNIPLLASTLILPLIYVTSIYLVFTKDWRE
jgi:hypothetical protein